MPYEFRIVSDRVRRSRVHRDGVWEPLERQLNRLSAAGWELVSVSTSPTGTFFVGAGEYETVTTAVLRRPLEGDAGARA